MSILFTSQCLFHAQSKFKSPILLLKPSLFSSQRLPWKSKPLDGRWLIRKLITTICFVSAGPIIPSTLNVAFYIWRARGRWIIPSSSTLCTGAIFFFLIGPFALELWQRLFSQARSCEPLLTTLEIMLPSLSWGLRKVQIPQLHELVMKNCEQAGLELRHSPFEKLKISLSKNLQVQSAFPFPLILHPNRNNLIFFP